MLTEEEIKVLQEENQKNSEEKENYKKALQEERSKRKQAESELTHLKESGADEVSELKGKVTDLEKKLSSKKELLTEKDQQITDLSEQVKLHTDKSSKYDEHVNKSLEGAMGKIPEEKKDFVSKALTGKSLEEQLELAEGFATEYANANYNANPKGGGDDPKKLTEFDKAKESKNVMGMLQNAPEIKE